ncbi:MAG: sn-glycerol-3-phosphate ABC transporter ATP-binding protein UgpC [Candidatus Latescibacteria bacterium]|nr:sn-glycerol-3-phosphate ABC transporter ATP-binding protein UgpC [Candidatus Latescibacterota bacterium]NIM66481.1 sn-glycerol-3-phosphate ABC transporter ATP-binding protein UgpC [Candidatus Latescibacterota bacterium]NIO02961.1 sn-glycerol-3-phosphate ABC transporter ATP-binding protein UgpC [Candidatus Latescibacterota bacterium]NIO30096.1 sn-glycerol-3-phosphate ABC transporter ATP-binding protein UgpC [Candidatus Latescibacterota bacterium]NIO57715.1 sn-glycerol-3-phosphate ABC transpor
MSDLDFSHLEKVYDNGVVAVSDFHLRIPGPTLAVIVGPSGCGKTTVLRLIAGLEKPTRGEIHLGGKRLDTLEPRRRDVAMVFQSYALYPHMTVGENLSFGLRLRKMPRASIQRRVQEVSRTLEIDKLLHRKPGELSGGQRQRVALGRAIIREPKVFLFDEPLSNLDARLRVDMRYTIKKLFQRLKVTTVYVTHDQVEAMTIGEMLVVMSEGKIHQVGTPEACYQSPRDTFVATFLGSPPMRLLKGRLDPTQSTLQLGEDIRMPIPPDLADRLRRQEDELLVGVRPEHVRPYHSDSDPRGVDLKGDIVLTEPLGHETLTHLKIGTAELVARGKERFQVDKEGRTAVFVDPDRLHFFSKANGERIDTEPASDS